MSLPNEHQHLFQQWEREFEEDSAVSEAVSQMRQLDRPLLRWIGGGLAIVGLVAMLALLTVSVLASFAAFVVMFLGLSLAIRSAFGGGIPARMSTWLRSSDG